MYLLDEVFWKQILHKSIINLCFALSSIAAEIHLTACPYRAGYWGNKSDTNLF